MKVKGKLNLPRIVWVSCLFLFLIVILIMVMDYKINYEYNVASKIYFYQCEDQVCTTEVEDNDKELYSVYECDYGNCPVYKKVINDDYAVLENDDGYILYNYKLGTKITEGYDNYVFINNDYIIVTKDELDGVIDINNNVVVKTEYDKIGYYKGEYLYGYSSSNIIAMKEDVYGIINYKDASVVEVFKYKESEIQTLLDIIENG